MNEYNQKALNDAYKNAHIALQSIADLLPSVEDENLKQHLKEEYSGYEAIMKEISSYMLEENLTPKDINGFKKAMLWGSIKMKVAMDNSKNQIADMMLKGTVMGINELYAMVNESQNLEDGVRSLIEKLLHLEEEYEKTLRKFL
jgi:hypothetical protein